MPLKLISETITNIPVVEKRNVVPQKVQKPEEKPLESSALSKFEEFCKERDEDIIELTSVFILDLLSDGTGEGNFTLDDIEIDANEVADIVEDFENILSKHGIFPFHPWISDEDDGTHKMYRDTFSEEEYIPDDE